MEAQVSERQRKKYERNTFLFLIIFLAPALAISFVGGFGLIIWVSQMLIGPPTS